MNHRVLLACTSLLLGSAVTAQTTYRGEGPALAWPVALVPKLQPIDFKTRVLTSIAARRLATGELYLGVGARSEVQAPPRIGILKYDPRSSTLTALPDADKFTVDNDQDVALSRDLLQIAVFRIGAGIEVGSRKSINEPFGNRRPLLGQSNGYSPQFAYINGREHLMTCEIDPTTSAPRIVFGEFDRTAVRLTNVRWVSTPVGQRGNYLQFATPVEDPLGETRGVVYVERQYSSFRQRMFFRTSIDTNAAHLPILDSPLNNVLTGASFVQGFQLMAVCLAALPTAVFPNGLLGITGAVTFDYRVPLTGGRVQLSILAPRANPRGFATLAVGALGTTGVDVPGITGRVGLDLNTPIYLLPFLSTPEATAVHTLTLPKLSPFTIYTQVVVTDENQRVLVGSNGCIEFASGS